MPYTRLVAKLKALTAVTDLVSSRIYPLVRPPGDLPAITYQRVSRAPVDWANGTTTTNWTRIQLTCWASTYDGAVALAAAVRGDEAESSPSGIAGWEDSNGDIWRLENEMDAPEPPGPGKARPDVFGVIQDYMA